ncbi:AAA family ATPase [bacterium]|nr:MAG: AAA family ATPase [bacterium]
MRKQFDEINVVARESVVNFNRGFALAHNANISSMKAMEVCQELKNMSSKIYQDLHIARESLIDVQGSIDDFKTTMRQAGEEICEQVRQEAARNNQEAFEDKRRLIHEKIHEKQRQGIFEQGERIRAQATVDAEEVKWQRVKEMLEDPYLIAKMLGALTGFVFGCYLIKYGVPLVIDYFSHPRVISETSEDRWFWQDEITPETELKDLFFTPNVQERLFDLVLRIDSARSFNENLPNVLLYGPPGTGKTAFVKALAHESNFDYALTSGSEFAKITDLSSLNDELRKLIEWANDYSDDSKGLIVFIDEAESLFANRKLATTSTLTQNFINTFLALVQDSGQKNIMFIFATNHPFKLDDAVLDRLGVSIEVELPGVQERALILAAYLQKFANDNKDSVVSIQPEVMNRLFHYAEMMEGFSPRTIKFIAEEMIVVTRRQKNVDLTDAIVTDIIRKTQGIQQKVQEWKKERDAWVTAQLIGVGA